MTKIFVISRTEYFQSGIGDSEETTVVVAFTDEGKADAYIAERKDKPHNFYDKTELTLES